MTAADRQRAHEYATIVAETIGNIEKELDGNPDVPEVETLIDDVLGVLEWRYEAVVGGPVLRIIALVSYGGPTCEVVVGDGLVRILVRDATEEASVDIFADHFSELVWAMVEPLLPREAWR